MKLNKKGSFGDIFYIAVVMFLFAIVITVGWVIHDKINDKWQTKTELGTASLEIMQQSNDDYISLFDGVFLTMFVGLYIGSLILAYNIDVSPLFFFLSLFIMGVIVVITAVLGNSYYAFSQNAGLINYADDFTFIPFILNNYVAVFVVMMFGLAGVMYAKTN